MKKILVGYIGIGKTSGIDKYLLNFLEKINEKDIHIDFLTRYYDEELKKELNKKGCNIYCVSRNRHFIKQYKEMRHILKNQYDIAYFNVSETYNCVGIIAAKLAKVKKIVVHSHNSDIASNNSLVKFLKETLNFIFKPLISKCANTYLACSDLAAKWLFTKRIYKQEKYQIIYNSVDFKKFGFNSKTRTKIRKDFDIDDKFVLGFIGRFNYQKNTKFLVDILLETIKEKQNTILLCIGDGEEIGIFKEYAKEKNVLDKIIFAGVVDNAYDYYQAFDVFLLPSLYEGLPIVGVEAQINGCPCIFSDRITKNVIIGKNSYRESIKDAKVWAKRINSINKRDNELLEVAKNYDLNNSDQFNKIIDL